jgi:hypothetical protein
MLNITNYFCALGFFFINITVQGISLFMVSRLLTLINVSMLIYLAYDSQGSRLDSHQGPVILGTSLRLRLPYRHRRRLCLGQDKPSWTLPRHLHTSGYCGFRHHALGY